MRGLPTTKSPALRRAFSNSRERALRRLVLQLLDLRLRRLHSPRRLGEALLDELQRLGLGYLVDRRDLAHDAVERRLVELALAVGLLGLRLGTVEVAHDLGDRDKVARIDLRLVFLGAARPHGALDAGAAGQHLQGPLDEVWLGELAHADRGRLRGRDA